MPDPAFTYAQLLEHHKRARETDPEVVPEDLPSFAEQLNALTGSHDYDAGLVDNPVRRAAEVYTDVTKPAGNFGKALGEKVNDLVHPSPEWSHVAPDALQGAATVLPDMLVAGGLSQLGVPAPLSFGTLAGGRTYAETGDIGQSLVSGGTAAASFKAGELGRIGALKAVGAPTLGEASQLGTAAGSRAADAVARVGAAEGSEAAAAVAGTRAPATVAQWLAAHAGMNLGMQGTFEVGNAINRAIRGEPLAPSPQELVTSLVSQAPYSLWEGIAHGSRPISQEAKAIVAQSKKNFQTVYKDTMQQTGSNPTQADLNVAYNRVLRNAGLDVDTATLRSIKNESYVDPDYADQLIEEHNARIRAESGRKADIDLTLATKGEAVDVTKLSENEQALYDELSQKTNRTPDEDDQLQNLTEAATVKGKVNPEIVKRITAISGSPLERGTGPARRNILERAQGFQWLREYNANKNKQRLDEESLGKVFDDPSEERKATLYQQIQDLEDAGRHEEAEPLYDLIDQEESDSSQEKGMRSSYKAQLPEETAAGQRAALKYDASKAFPASKFPNRRLGKDPSVDWQDPMEVRAFEKYVFKSMSASNKARPAEQKQISDHPTKVEADLNAHILNDSLPKDSEFRYRAPKNANDKGRFVVLKERFYRHQQLIEDWKQSLSEGGKTDLEDYLHELENGTLHQGPVSADDAFQIHLDRAAKAPHPGQRAALEDALVTNVLSAVKNLHPDTITRITGKVRTPGQAARRLARYLEFIRSGGKVETETVSIPKREVMSVFENEQEAKLFAQQQEAVWGKKNLTVETREIDDEEPGQKKRAFAVLRDSKDGGTIKSIRGKAAPKGTPEEQTDLYKLNQALGDLGYKNYNQLNERDNSKLNFFEQMNVLGKYIAQGFQNPNDLFTRPPGEFGHDVGVIEGKGGKWQVYGAGTYPDAKGKVTNLPYRLRNGQTQMFKHDGKGNPLLSLLAELRKKQGIVKHSVIIDMLTKMDDKDVPPDLKALLQFYKDKGSQEVEFGVAVSKDERGAWDSTSRGHYNYVRGLLEGNGGMVSPYYRDPFTNRVMWLKPADMAAVFAHELWHANTAIALWKHPELRAEMKKVHDYVRQKYDEARKMNETVGLPFQSLLGMQEDTVASDLAGGKTPKGNAFGVDEFFAEMATNPELRKFVWSLPDDPETFGPIPQASVKQFNIFHRFWSAIKKWMFKEMGVESTPFAERVQAMQEKVLMAQRALGQLHKPGVDLYEKLASAIYQPGDIVLTPQRFDLQPGERIKNTTGGGKGGMVIPQGGSPEGDLGRSWFKRPPEGVTPFDEWLQEPDLGEPATTSEPPPLPGEKPTPEKPPSIVSKTPEMVDAEKERDRKKSLDQGKGGQQLKKGVTIEPGLNETLLLNANDPEITDAMMKAHYELQSVSGEGKAKRWVWKKGEVPEEELKLEGDTTLESRSAPIDVDKLRRGLQYGAKDWTDEPDGSWTFTPQHAKGGFLGDWSLSKGTDYREQNGRVTITPSGQSSLAAMLNQEVSQQSSKNVFKAMPQFVSGFETLVGIYNNAGYTQRQSQQMATLMTRYLMAWKKDWSVMGVMRDPDIIKRAGGLAFRGDTQEGGYRAALAPDLLKGWNKSAWIVQRAKHVLLHELFHNSDAHSELTRYGEMMSPEDRALLINISHEINGSKVENDHNWQAAVDNPDEFAADIASRLFSGLVDSHNPSLVLKEYLNYFDDSASHWLSDQFRTRHEMIRNFVDSAAAEGEDAQGMAEYTSKFTKEMMRPVEEAEAMTTRALQMRYLYPDNYYEMVGKVNDWIDKNQKPNLMMSGADTDPTVLQSRVPGGQQVREVLGLLPNHKLSWWNKTLTRFNLLAKQYPDLVPVWNAVDVANRMAHEAIVRTKSVLIGAQAANNVDPRGIRRDVQDFVKSDNMQSAFSKVALDIQIASEKGADLSPQDRDTLLRRYLPDDRERRITNHVMQATLEQNALIGQYIMRGHRVSAELILGIAARKYLRGAMTVDQARQFSRTMFQSLDAAMGGRVQEAQNLTAQLQQMVPNTKALGDLMQSAQDMYATYDETGKLSGGLAFEKEFLAKRGGWWMTERRFGDYGLYYRDGGVMKSHFFERMQDRDKFAVGKQDVRFVDKDGPSGNLGLNQGLLDRLSDLDTKFTQKLRDAIGDDEMQNLGLGVDLSGEMRAAMLAQDVSNTSIRRKHAPGKEFLSMYDNQQLYHSATIGALKNKQMKLETALALTDPVFDKQPDLKRVATTHLANVLEPDTEWGRRISTTNFFYYLVGNMSNMFLEPFQQLMSLSPALTEAGDGVVQGYKRLARANKDVLAHRVGGKRYQDVGLQAAVLRARDEGVIDHGLLEELDYHPDLNYTNSLRAINGKKEYGLFDMLKNKAFVAANLGRKLYSIMPTFNNEVAFVTAFRQEFERSKSTDSAYEFAAKMTRDTMFGGGKIGRPVGAFSPRGPILGRTASQAMYSLQSYNTSMMTLMGHYLKQSFKPRGLSDGQTKQVRLAAAQMFGTQMIAAGALGMPFVAGAIATLNQFFPQVDWDKTVRDFLTGWIDDNNSMGGFLRDFVTKGLPSATQHGPDMGSRFALGGTLGVSPYNGIQPENLLGPTASLATNALRAGQKAVTGEPIKAAHDLLPAGFQRMIDALTQGREFKNKQGDLLLNDLTPTEMMARAAGFTPNRAARVQDSARLAKQATTSRNARMDAQVGKWAEMWVDGQADKVRDQVLDAEVRSQGQDKARDLIHAVAERVEKTTMLQDPRRLGNRGTAESVDGLLRLMQKGGAVVPTEVQRLQKRDEVGTSLGLPSQLTKERVGRSSAIDRLLQMNPALSRASAAMALEHPGRDLVPGLNYGQVQAGY